MGSIPCCVLPMESFLPFRKAIMSMKDIAYFMVLRIHNMEREYVLEVSIMDDFRSTGLYVLLPICQVTAADTSDIFALVPSQDLLKLNTLLKTYPASIRLHFHEANRSVRITNASHTTRPLLQQSMLFPFGVLEPRYVPLINNKEYLWVSFISEDLLTIFVDLSVGSAIMHLTLFGDGKISFKCQHEYGETEITKQLKLALETKTEGEDPSSIVIARISCVIKFIKQVVNSLVNCSQKTCLLGIPKQENNTTLPLVLQFLCVARPKIYEYFLMFPFKEPLTNRRHKNAPFQNPLQWRCGTPDSLVPVSQIIGFQQPVT